MILYHGTSKARLPSILEHGLKCNYDSYSRGHVYFEKTFSGAQSWSVKWEVPVILEFDIPKKLVEVNMFGGDICIVPTKVSSKFLKKIWIWDKKKIKWINIL